MKPERIEHELQNVPVPPPPADLADRIKDEIPADLPVVELDRHRPSSITPSPHRQWRLAAAAVVTVALTGAITWEMRHRQPSEDLLFPTPPAVRVTPLEPAGSTAGSGADTLPPVAPPAEAPAPTAGSETAPVPTGPDATAVQPNTAPQATPNPAPAARTGGVRSIITSQDGATLPGVTVTLTDPSTGLIRTAITNTRGEAVIGSLPDGTYEVTSTLDGFNPIKRRIAVEEDRLTLNALEMSLGAITDTIEVTGEAPVVDVTSTVTGITVSTEELNRSVPLARGAGAGAARAENRPAPTRPAVPGTFIPAPTLQPSTGGTAEPNDQPYGDVFFREYGVNPFVDTEDDRFSTFGLEVDTGSYTVARRYLRDGHLPPREAIRVEEIVNAFDYGDPGPTEADFALTAEGGPTPFAEGRRYRVVRFAVTARTVDRDQRPPAVLTFVVDVSGSMGAENRLGLVKKSLYQLLDHLRADDRVGLVIYGSRGEVLLEPSTDHERIRSAIDRLHSGGSTNAEEGLVLAYDLAARFLDRERINRVILCSDGVANVGRTGPDSILERIRGHADRGIELTTVGFGMGNYNDVLMEQLADAGDGRYAYVDTLNEARRLFVEELTGTLLTLGHEAKAQVEFNPDAVSRYRLLGYENRDIADERFRDPTVDAGEIGAGHTVTALYEIKLQPRARKRANLATLRFRYRPLGSDEPLEMERSIRVGDLASTWEKATPALRLAALAAEYAELLKGTYWAREGSFGDVLQRIQELTPAFAGDTRVADFTSLVATAAELSEGREDLPEITDGE